MYRPFDRMLHAFLKEHAQPKHMGMDFLLKACPLSVKLQRLFVKRVTHSQFLKQYYTNLCFQCKASVIAVVEIAAITCIQAKI